MDPPDQWLGSFGKLCKLCANKGKTLLANHSCTTDSFVDVLYLRICAGHPAPKNKSVYIIHTYSQHVLVVSTVSLLLRMPNLG